MGAISNSSKPGTLFSSSFKATAGVGLAYRIHTATGILSLVCNCSLNSSVNTTSGDPLSVQTDW